MKSVLFVCTGNTCRSPLAEGLMRREVERRHLDVSVSSAGTHAADGSPASDYSVQAARKRGVDLSGHRSRGLDPEVLAGADLVLAMSPSHLAALRAHHGGKLEARLVTEYLPAHHPMRARPVADPFGGDAADYEAVAQLLEQCVESILACCRSHHE